MGNSGLPEYRRDDPRIGRKVRTDTGFVGTIESVLFFPNGTEYIRVSNEKGKGEGGLTPEQITFLD